jgi:hypothetical protein
MTLTASELRHTVQRQKQQMQPQIRFERAGLVILKRMLKVAIFVAKSVGWLSSLRMSWVAQTKTYLNGCFLALSYCAWVPAPPRLPAPSLAAAATGQVREGIDWRRPVRTQTPQLAV